jgi:chromosome partitioning protein
LDAVNSRQLLEGLDVPVMSVEISLLAALPKAEMAGTAVRDARTDSGRPDPGAARAWEQVAALAAEIDTHLEAA